jgi:hypothetical protein
VRMANEEPPSAAHGRGPDVVFDVGTHEVGTPVSQKDSPLTCPEVRERD